MIRNKNDEPQIDELNYRINQVIRRFSTRVREDRALVRVEAPNRISKSSLLEAEGASGNSIATRVSRGLHGETTYAYFLHSVLLI